MNTPLERMVKSVIAHRIDVTPELVRPADHLRRDLGLDDLDLVLVALELESIAEIEFPLAELELVHTVADFLSVARMWLGAEDRLAS
jgi:acyl carrier protein